MHTRRRIVIAGGGAAGFFAAITCAEADPSAEVVIYEATAHPLAKVRISGGGRCNVTHACFEPRELVKFYPRGARELLGPFTRFGPRETVAWFADRGVKLKTEADGRMFPITDDSATIVDCLQNAAAKAGVQLVTRCGITSVTRPEPARGELVASAERAANRFSLTLTTGEILKADRLLLATGGTKGSAGLTIAEKLGHTIVPPVPSLFTFHIDDSRLRGLEGLSMPLASATVRDTRLRASGPILITHWGLSGPAILKLSSWGARELYNVDYRFTLGLNWAEPRPPAKVQAELEAERTAHPRRRVATANPFSIPARLWERLVVAAGLAPDMIWTHVSNNLLRSLTAQVASAEFAVTGKSMNKEEFVTCGGVNLREVDFSTMKSRICPGLYFAGEVLDIDGLTGGFNFQSAWTTGWHAGRTMVGVKRP
ncbi:MAG TPA: NAD(P)/FAD-dependent oxidoreductase [Opitutaceae bacterium]|nr:NAD(P)/FAD-dependent oxidoreductase [Opitutaceae bacterium]